MFFKVHKPKLADYLQYKKLEGYTLVGVEQTANSVCLTEYDFPTKTLLLLGYVWFFFIDATFSKLLSL